MTKHDYVVQVPRPHAPEFSPDRPITDLVRNQIMHLSLAERHLPARDRSGIDIYSIQTEGQAAEYIRHVTKKLHPEGAEKPKRSPKSKSKKHRPKMKKRGKGR
jgi:hypothetical protein